MIGNYKLLPYFLGEEFIEDGCYLVCSEVQVTCPSVSCIAISLKITESP